MANTPVSTTARQGMVEGQAQAKRLEPDDGRHFVHEAHTVTDVVITDANSELAVQVPEGVGASTAGHESPMGATFARGTAEEQFAGETSDESANEDSAAAPAEAEASAPAAEEAAPAAEPAKS